MRRAIVLAALAFVLAISPRSDAGPRKRAMKSRPAPIATLGGKETAAAAPTRTRPAKATKTRNSKPTGDTGKVAKGAARVAFVHGGELRPAPEVVGRREEPLTLEEDIAKRIEKLLRGPLRRGITGLYVADARTGAPLFAVNADDPLNPASNVKMISTAAALELLGPTYRYSTRVLGREPDRQGRIQGDLYLLGTWDPTLTTGDMDELARQIAARGVKQVDGNVVVGSDPTRDGIYHSVVPIDIVAGEPGQPPSAITPPNFDLVEVVVKAKTDKRPRKRHKLRFATETFKNAAGHKRLRLTVTGSIGKDGETTYRLYTRERTAIASHALIAALRGNGVIVQGDMATGELGDFVGTQVGAQRGLPIELARHHSDQLQDIVRRINKWSINWLADRVIMTAAALAKRTQPSMQVALEAMYEWLQRHPQLDKSKVVIDTGSGLSYRTRITPEEIVKVVRAAAGYIPGTDPTLTKAWHESLAVAGTDGTLRARFRGGAVKGAVNEIRGHLRGKTGSLSTVIALSGLLELDPTRPLAFAIVTNTDRPLKKPFIRKAHEQLVSLLARYVKATAKPTSMPVGTPIELGTPKVTPLPELDEKALGIPDEVAEPQLDPELDEEAAGKATDAEQPAP